MNYPKLKRRIIHIFFSLAIFISVSTPVYALAADITTPTQLETVPVTKPISLTTPKPSEAVAFIGPQKPESSEVANPSLTPSPLPTTSPTKTPTPTITPSPTLTPTPAPTIRHAQSGSNSSNGGLNADVLFNMSNSYRTNKGLPPFQTDARVCALAQARAPQIASEISGGHMHSGKNSHNFPYHFTENIITMRTEAEAFNWWINDHIHRVQIEENNTHSCVACDGNACVQHFTSFKPK